MEKNIDSNFIDKAIEYIAPGIGLKRKRSRAILSFSNGGYTGGKRNRPALSNYNPGVGDANSDTIGDLINLRGRSRDLARNSPVACGAINANINYAVGTGLSMQPRIDYKVLGLSDVQAEIWQENTQREFEMYAQSKDCDATMTQNFYEQQGLVLRSALESGDVICVLANIQRKKTYDLAIQILEADRICNPNLKGDTATLVDGIELDQYGAATHVHICKTHPGALRSIKLEWIKVPVYGASTGRRNVLHIFERKRPGQTRGAPYLSTVIESLKQLERYTEAELQAAVISAAFAVFVTMDAEAFDLLFESDNNAKKAYFNESIGWNGKIPEADIGSPGKAINLLPGEHVESPDLGRPNDKFDPFVLAITRQIGVALELPFEVLIKHFTASYSASRAALLDAWRLFRRRRDWLASNFCQPVYEAWLEEAVAKGRIHAPGFFADAGLRAAWCKTEWIGDGPGSIDPEKEINAATKRYELGITTLEAESVMYDGIPWRMKHPQQVKEKKLRDEAGMAMPNQPPAAATPNQPSNNGSDLET